MVNPDYDLAAQASEIYTDDKYIDLATKTGRITVAIAAARADERKLVWEEAASIVDAIVTKMRSCNTEVTDAVADSYETLGAEFRAKAEKE